MDFAETEGPQAAGPLVGVVMGSRSDYAVMKAAVAILREFAVPCEARVVSAHRTPELLYEYAQAAAGRGLRCIIAGAGGAAHLPGMLAALTVVPVLGVPVAATALQGLDALLSIVQMPKGVPVGTLAIGAAGAANAALLAVAMLATTDATLQAKLVARRAATRDQVLAETLDEAEA
jgi:5-(carboxyamino)imidazole ribonucleotide mutase